MKLRDTVEGMLSKEYKERFRAEYFQLKLRLEKLDVLIRRAEAGELDFALTCPLELLQQQRREMSSYLLTLIQRAAIEDVDLTEYFN